MYQAKLGFENCGPSNWALAKKLRLRRGANRDLTDIYVFRLFEDICPCASHCFRRHGKLLSGILQLFFYFRQRSGYTEQDTWTADVIIPTNSSVMYYERVQSAMAKTAVDGFTRLYLAPGFGHGAGAFRAGFYALGLLDQWTETGSPALNLTVTDKTKIWAWKGASFV